MIYVNTFFADIVLIIFLIIGLIEGWKRGLLTSAIKLVSTILIFILALLLKGPISLILIEHLPFFKFSGIFADITTLNIILYEGISFLLVVILLSIIFKIILKLTKGINKLINATIILALPNKVGGALINFLRYYIITFIFIFILSLIPYTSYLIKESKFCDNILNKTPILSSLTKNVNKSLNEVYDLVKSIDETTESDEINKDVLKILLKEGIISKETVNNLNKSGKLKIDNVDSILEKYEGE